jgi:uncharacterized membrane protein YraQ (UPF0718 family)
MDMLTVIFWIIAVLLMIVSFFSEKQKTLAAMKKTKGMMGNMLGDMIGIILLIGLMLTLIPPETIRSVLGSANPCISTAFAALAGSITLIPAFVAFPLAGSLVDAGAGILPAVAFLTTLTMVGIVTLPLEKKEFGIKFALTRNMLSFGFAIGIAWVMGVIL